MPALSGPHVNAPLACRDTSNSAAVASANHRCLRIFFRRQDPTSAGALWHRPLRHPCAMVALYSCSAPRSRVPLPCLRCYPPASAGFDRIRPVSLISSVGSPIQYCRASYRHSAVFEACGEATRARSARAMIVWQELVWFISTLSAMQTPTLLVRAENRTRWKDCLRE